MDKLILITGGARSGKSAHAEALVSDMAGDPVYIATAEPGDAEMRERIALHRARRGEHWRLVEVPIDLAGALQRVDSAGPILVDCLTLWLSNLMLAGRDPEAETEKLIRALAKRGGPVVLVTNEVGLGIVPDNALARAYRDAAGRMNHQIADLADEIYFVVAGQPMKVK